MTHRSLYPRRAALVAGTFLLVPLGLSSTALAATATGVVSVSPATGLKDGSSVTVTYSGFPASANVVAVQCAEANPSTPAPCDTTNLGIGKADAAGKGTVTFTVHTGSIGNGTCDNATHNACVVYVSDNPQTTVGFGKITFATAAPATAPTPTPTPSPTASQPATAGSGSVTDAPSAVAAGSGGGADRNAMPWEAAIALLVGTGLLVGRPRATRG